MGCNACKALAGRRAAAAPRQLQKASTAVAAPHDDFAADTALEDLDEGSRASTNAVVRFSPGARRDETIRDVSSAASDGVQLRSLGDAMLADSSDLGKICQRASQAAARYLLQRLLDPKWAKAHDDVAYYCKAPVVFLELGQLAEANRALDLAEAYVDRGGLGSREELYSQTYPQGPLMWICWAASRLGRRQLAERCLERLLRYVHPVTRSGLVKAPYSSPLIFEADFFATALVIKAALAMDKMRLATEGGEALLRAIEANHNNMLRHRFNLRWRWSDGFLQETDPHLCVMQGGSGQEYSMLGFPAAMLFELASARKLAGGTCLADGRRAPAAQVFQTGALELLSFLRGCGGLSSSPTSHAAAYAAAMGNDRRLSGQIVVNVASLQKGLGCFGADPDSTCSVDQAADIAISFAAMSKFFERQDFSSGATTTISL
mmetsp:Transcript_27810/g.62783  ORF Transcript_27810/g.62783 Transcript_27810/m.62783 type:complete len:434 (-) Transcript_27810:50-1351(-)